MTDTVDFWTNPRSRGAIVHWMLEEVGRTMRSASSTSAPR